MSDLKDSNDPKSIKKDVLYEIVMFFETAENVYKSERDSYQEYAFLESFLIHLRSLIHFFMDNSRKKCTDALSKDFLKDGATKKLLNKGLNINDFDWGEITKKISWKVAHITYNRDSPETKEYRWMVDKLILKIVPFMQEFIENINYEKFDKNSIAVIENLTNSYNKKYNSGIFTTIRSLFKNRGSRSTATPNTIGVNVGERNKNNY